MAGQLVYGGWPIDPAASPFGNGGGSSGSGGGSTPGAGAAASPYKPSQFYRTILRVPPENEMTVHDMSFNQADGAYMGPNTADVDVYGQTNDVRSFTTGSNSVTNKGLLLQAEKIALDFNAGDSLMILTRFRLRYRSFTVAAAGTNTGTGTIAATSCSGGLGTVPGAYMVTFDLSTTAYTVRDPSGAILGFGNVTKPYTGFGVNFTTSTTGFQMNDYFTITVGAATNTNVFGNNDNGNAFGINLAITTSGVANMSYKIGNGGTGGSAAFPTQPPQFSLAWEQWYNHTSYFDGVTRRYFGDFNGLYNKSNANTVLQPDSNGSYNMSNATPTNMGLGWTGNSSITSSAIQKVSYQSYDIIIVPRSAGTITNPRWIAMEFNKNPLRTFSDSEILGV